MSAPAMPSAREHPRPPRVRAPRAEEREPLLAWLDRGLRRGVAGALEREYPLGFDPRAIELHRVAFDGPTPLAHALAMPATAHVRGATLPLGMIGSVFTAPSYRGRGLARACVADAVEALRARGAALALLWSELDALYEPLGFTPAGRDWLDVADARCIARARSARPANPVRLAKPATSAEWQRLDELAESRPSRIERSRGALERMAQAPACELVAAWSPDGEGLAYAARGRGDDFPEVVHDWAGETGALLDCLLALARGRDAIGLLSSSDAQPHCASDGLVAALRGAGAHAQPRPLAQVRLIDARTVWERATRGIEALESITIRDRGDRIELAARAGSCALSHASFTRLVLGCGDEPIAVPESLARDERDALEACLPLPLYVWGFDSI